MHTASVNKKTRAYQFVHHCCTLLIAYLAQLASTNLNFSREKQTHRSRSVTLAAPLRVRRQFIEICHFYNSTGNKIRVEYRACNISLISSDGLLVAARCLHIRHYQQLGIQKANSAFNYYWNIWRDRVLPQATNLKSFRLQEEAAGPLRADDNVAAARRSPTFPSHGSTLRT